MGLFYVFKKIVDEMDLRESLLTNGDLDFIKILNTELIPSKEKEGINVYKIEYKKIDKETATQMALERALEELKQTKPEKAQEIMEGKKKVPSKLKKKKLNEAMEELYKISPVFSTKFEFYICDRFLLVPKFKGKFIIEEEYLIKFPEIKNDYLIDDMIKKNIFSLGCKTKQTLEDKVEVIVCGEFIKGKIKEGDVLCDDKKVKIKINPLVIRGKLEEIVDVANLILDYIEGEKNECK